MQLRCVEPVRSDEVLGRSEELPTDPGAPVVRIDEHMDHLVAIDHRVTHGDTTHLSHHHRCVESVRREPVLEHRRPPPRIEAFDHPRSEQRSERLDHAPVVVRREPVDIFGLPWSEGYVGHLDHVSTMGDAATERHTLTAMWRASLTRDNAPPRCAGAADVASPSNR